MRWDGMEQSASLGPVPRPFTFHFVHLLNFLDPRRQVSSPCQCTENLKKVLAFRERNERDCDDIISEFIPVVGSDKFCNFNPVCTRVDSFYSEQLKSFPKLFSLIKMLMFLSQVWSVDFQ